MPGKLISLRRQVSLELLKLFKWRMSWLGLCVIGCGFALTYFAQTLGSAGWSSRSVATLNAWSIAVTPLLTIVVACFVATNELRRGMLSNIFLLPISKMKFYLVKYVAVLIYSALAALVAVLCLAAYLAALSKYGGDPSAAGVSKEFAYFSNVIAGADLQSCALAALKLFAQLSAICCVLATVAYALAWLLAEPSAALFIVLTLIFFDVGVSDFLLKEKSKYAPCCATTNVLCALDPQAQLCQTYYGGIFWPLLYLAIFSLTFLTIGWIAFKRKKLF